VYKNINTDVNKCGDDGVSPLYIACQNGYLDIVVELLDKNVYICINLLVHHRLHTCLHLY
jgi:ankyrin repeat protein